MARYTYNGTNLDLAHNTTAISASVATISVAGIFSTPFTAPNTTNKVTGVWVFFNSVPTANNVVITLQESTVDKVSTTLIRTDIRLGWNYVRFATPYQFTTTSANAYRFKATNASNSGALRIDGALFSYSVTIDNTIAVSSLAVGDDLWVGGIHNGTFNTQSLTLTGTSLSFGSGTDKAMTSTTTASIGAAITVGNGGTVKMDDTASCTVQIRGSILVTTDGVFDKRANASDVTKVSKLIFDVETTNGDYGFMLASGAYAGRILTTGKTVNYSVQRGSGSGTTASPWVPASAIDSQVGDEVIFGGSTDYLKNELKYIKTRNSSTSFILCDTPGGVESGLAQTHAATSYVGLMTRNSIVSSQNTARGYWLYNSAVSTIPASAFDYTRFEYNNTASGKSMSLNTSGNAATIDGAVFYQSAANGRQCLTIANPVTVTGVIVYNQQGTSFSGQSGICVQSSSVILNDCLGFAAPGSTIMTALISFLNATNGIVNNCHAYGCNASNTSIGYAFGMYNAAGIIYNNCSADGSRIRSILGSTAQNIVFNNCTFGTVGNNAIDVATVDASLNTMLFNNCSFGSTNLVTNYLNMLEGSEISFQDMDGNTSKHRWYNNHGSFWSSGSGLTDTTVRTASSLALAIKPENSTNGAEMYFKVPANPTSNVQIYGYMYRNATFSSGDITVDLFLPGTLLTDTPDATTTLATTTGAWQIWSLNAYNSGSVARYATVRIRAKTATAGAYVFLDDIYDATTNNKVAGMDLWDEGHISPIMLALDLSAVPEQTRVAVWSDNSTYSAGQKGHHLTQKLLTVAKFLGLK